MAGFVVGYARCFDGDDEKVQHAALVALGVPEDRVYLDVGYTVQADRPALERALSACCSGDTLVAASLDRLARSMRDLLEVVNTLADIDASIAFDGLIFDLATPIGQMMLALTSAFAKFESDHFRARTQEGMAKSRLAGGRRPGKAFALDPAQRRQLLADHESGDYSIRDLMRKYPVARSSIYATINRERDARLEFTTTASAECQDTTT
jgi:DNA invertase Pin-like site-specific DNA recombinase